MKISCHRQGEWVIVGLKGQVDAFTYPLWAKELNVLMRTGVQKLRIDLTDGSIFHLTSLQLITSIVQQMNERDGEIEIVGADSNTTEMIKLMSSDENSEKQSCVNFR